MTAPAAGGAAATPVAGDGAPALVDAPAPADAPALAERVARARDCFARAGITVDEAAADAEVLARHVLDWDRATYLARRRDPAPTGFEVRYAPLADRRARREPVSTITGRREFWGLTFAVGPAVLTPRPATELIVETALALFGDRRAAPLAIADVGTGSGCLAVTLAREFPRAAVTGVDISPAALAMARRNAAAHGVADRIDWVEASLADWLASAAGDGGGGEAAPGGGSAGDRAPTEDGAGRRGRWTGGRPCPDRDGAGRRGRGNRPAGGQPALCPHRRAGRASAGGPAP